METRAKQTGKNKQWASRSNWFSRILAELFLLNTEADMAMIEMLCVIPNEMKPAIVWRNPNVLRGRRRHTSAPSLGRNRYVLQEYDGYHGFWRTISDLEVVTGGRAA
jgi:hypothetical protein